MSIRKIQPLDPIMINQIAAGEVVERPLSVVKELAENAIDAGASAITVEIKDGGITYIRVTDNGCGIPKEDVRTAFMRHATSKVLNPEDLTRINTLGFRGEALSSIAAVSQAEMVTKTASDITGLRIQLSGGEVISEKETGCADGTSVIVRNLFSNTPARLKFLKKPGTEGSLISDFMNRLALGRRDIAFKYINNGAVTLSSNGNGDLRAAILYVYGREYANKLIELKERADDLNITGFIAKPEMARPNRAHQNFFINGRYIKNERIQAAVEEGFAGKIMAGRFPAFILDLHIRPEMIDVNVHPNKLDVRFCNEYAVLSAIRAAVSKALGGSVIIPAVTAASKPVELHTEPVLEQMPLPLIKQRKPCLNEEYGFNPHPGVIPDDNAPSDTVYCTKHTRIWKDPEYEKPAENKRPFLPQYRIIGQFFQTYWIVESGDSVYIIDQHAAHERVLYENIKKRLSGKESASQRLIQPLALNLTPAECQILDDNRALIESIGFELENLGGTDILRSVPVLFKDPENAGFFIEILEKLNTKTTETDPYDLKIDAIAQTACKAAVKANNSLSFSEARALIEQMLALSNPFTCPHGRPTVVEMTKYEWEKKFKRMI